jgi:leader peptidase (prepilin peptidase) / N-methyltransferase
MIRRDAWQGAVRLTPLTAFAWGKSAALAVLACAMAGVSLAAAPGAQGWFGAALALLALAIAVIDARSFLIPDWLSAAAFLLALADTANGALQNYPRFFQQFFRQDIWLAMGQAIGLSIVRAAILGFAFFALRAIYSRLRGREGMGLGDVKLAAVAGAWLDWPLMPLAVEIAALAGLCAYAVGQFAGRRPFSGAVPLPFGLFFAPAIWFCWLVGTGFFEFTGHMR